MDRVRLIREFGHGFSLTPVPAAACATLCAPPKRDFAATHTFSTVYESPASARPRTPSPLQSIVCASTTPPTPLDSVGCAILGGGGCRHVFNLRCETREEEEGRGQRNGGNEQPHVCSHRGVSIPGSERAALDLSLRAVGAALRRPLWSAAARRRLALRYRGTTVSRYGTNSGICGCEDRVMVITGRGDSKHGGISPSGWTIGPRAGVRVRPASKAGVSARAKLWIGSGREPDEIGG